MVSKDRIERVVADVADELDIEPEVVGALASAIYEALVEEEGLEYEEDILMGHVPNPSEEDE